MRPERWREIRAVFDRVRELSPKDRVGVLDDACGEDADLRREVDSLLAANDASETFLERPFAELTAPLAPAVPEKVGPWAIERPLGRGGMGSVYLGSRSDDAYRTRVAIKILRADLATADLVRRFRSERQILADLQHPNIARLLDGGTTEDGRPFLVMEYVEGEPIDRYCDSRRLDVRSRLELFRKICGAVHSAHRNLVVHRDLKPANVLVDTEGEPRLLDFGIAKLSDPAAAARLNLETSPGMAPMTLDSMRARSSSRASP